MNFLSWFLALSSLLFLFAEAISFHKATVCRQEAWRLGIELQTRSLLHDHKPFEREIELNCRLYVAWEQSAVYWQRLPNLKKHEFVLPIKGKI